MAKLPNLKLEVSEKKRWGRRLGVGLISIAHVDVFYGIAVAKGLSIEWFQTPAVIILGICLFIGGFLTATDLMNRWKK